MMDHGFYSEIEQNNTMAANFSALSTNDERRPSSKVSTTPSISNENTLGKKVNPFYGQQIICQLILCMLLA
jgi:hypothetical protein